MAWDIDPVAGIEWIERHIRVKNARRGGKKSIPIRATRAQREASEYDAFRLRGGWCVSVKARQVFFTTWCLCWALMLMIQRPGITILFVGPDKVIKGPIKEKWRIIWQSARRSLRGDWPGREADNATHFWLREPNGSRIVWLTSGKLADSGLDEGIGETSDLLIWSEMAKCSFVRTVLDAVLPTMIVENVIVDSTPPEIQGIGQEYLDIAHQARSDDHADMSAYFVPWYWRQDYRASRPAQDLTDEERALVRLGVTPFQIQWRRNKIAKYKDKFAKIYPETIEQALAPVGESVFDGEIIEALKQRKGFDGYDPPLTGREVFDALPARLRFEYKGNDLLCSPHWDKSRPRKGYCRIWHLPVKGRRYFLSLDGSKGTPSSDPQAIHILDEQDVICVEIRARVNLIVLSSAVMRLALWFECEFVEIEMDPDKYGAEVARNITSKDYPPEDEIVRWGGHLALRDRWPEARLIERKTYKASQVDRKECFVSYINGRGVECVTGPEMAREIIHLDPETREKPGKGYTDDLLDSIGIAKSCQKMAFVRRSKEKKRPVRTSRGFTTRAKRHTQDQYF